MSLNFLQKLEAAVKIHLKEFYLPPHRAKTPGWTDHDLKFFSRGADLLSTAFTEERARLPKNYLNKKEFRSAYILYFLLINAAKIRDCLEKLPPFPKRGPLRVLDLGCGPGTAALACADFFGGRPLEILGLEQNKNITRDARNLWRLFAPSPSQRFHIRNEEISPSNLPKILRRENFDLVIAANTLSEFSFQEQYRLAGQLLEKTACLILVEPALRKTTRDLMALRDRLAAEGRGFLLAPCPHQKNCPMLKANKRDWCHFYIPWKCPELIRRVDREIGNKHDFLKMAYMIFETVGQRPLRLPSFARVVSSPLLSKGKKELILCRPEGRLQKIGRLNKETSEANRDFDRIRRGDRVEWAGGDRVGVADRIKIFRATNSPGSR